MIPSLSVGCITKTGSWMSDLYAASSAQNRHTVMKKKTSQQVCEVAGEMVIQACLSADFASIGDFKISVFSQRFQKMLETFYQFEHLRREEVAQRLWQTAPAISPDSSDLACCSLRPQYNGYSLWFAGITAIYQIPLTLLHLIAQA